MGGGLMQLVAMGAQDVYLTGNPQITFFKVVYRRHTNFSKECIKQSLTGSTTSQTCTLSRNGDLVQEIYLYRKNAAVTAPTSVEVEIGGQKIDKHYSQWLTIYDDLFDDNNTLKEEIRKKGYLPLRFWFNRNPGLALPLIALQYHEVKINIEGATDATDLLVNYIYLDTDERRRFAQVSHEYLIEQVQHTGVETMAALSATATTKTTTLTFNHPVKALFWSWTKTTTATGVVEAADANDGPTGYDAKLQLNGHDRFDALGHLYFTGVQPYECDLKHVMSSSPADDVKAHKPGMYSFCLKPGEHQPSGTCNFSRIDNARLMFTELVGAVSGGAAATTPGLHIFAMNYNVLRIMSGMGGLAYSN